MHQAEKDVVKQFDLRSKLERFERRAESRDLNPLVEAAHVT
jgi:hypothetical protein